MIAKPSPTNRFYLATRNNQQNDKLPEKAAKTQPTQKTQNGTNKQFGAKDPRSKFAHNNVLQYKENSFGNYNTQSEENFLKMCCNCCSVILPSDKP